MARPPRQPHGHPLLHPPHGRLEILLESSRLTNTAKNDYCTRAEPGANDGILF